MVYLGISLVVCYWAVMQAKLIDLYVFLLGSKNDRLRFSESVVWAFKFRFFVFKN